MKLNKAFLLVNFKGKKEEIIILKDDMMTEIKDDTIIEKA